MKCLVILAAFMCLGAGAQASTARAGDCAVPARTNVKVRLTLTPEGVPINESLIKGQVNRVWNAKGVKVAWAATADPDKRPWESSARSADSMPPRRASVSDRWPYRAGTSALAVG